MSECPDRPAAADTRAGAETASAPSWRTACSLPDCATAARQASRKRSMSNLDRAILRIAEPVLRVARRPTKLGGHEPVGAAAIVITDELERDREGNRVVPDHEWN